MKNYEAIVAEGAPDYTAVGLVREGSSDVGVLVLPKSRGVSKAEGVVVATVENYLVERERGPVEGAVATLVERVRTKDGTECMVDLGSGFAFNLLTGDQLGF